MKCLMKVAKMTSMKQRQRQKDYRRRNKAKLRRKRKIRKEKQRAGAKMKKKRQTAGHSYQTMPADPSGDTKGGGGGSPEIGGLSSSSSQEGEYDPEQMPESTRELFEIEPVTGHDGDVSI